MSAAVSIFLTMSLRAHRSRPVSTPSIEVFSVFVGRENFKPLQVYGSIVVSSDACAFYVFKRETKEDAFGLFEHCKTIPILDGSRAYEDSLKMEFDLKDVESCLHIRGHTNWEERWLQEGSSWLDKQLCSVVPGQNGCFAAIHYTIFSEDAVQANIEVSIPNDEHGHVYGSIVAQYNNYDYTSCYNKDFYRITLFQRNQEDPAQRGLGGVIPLSRTRVVVPLNSSLIIEAELWIGVPGRFESCSREF